MNPSSGATSPSSRPRASRNALPVADSTPLPHQQPAHSAAVPVTYRTRLGANGAGTVVLRRPRARSQAMTRQDPHTNLRQVQARARPLDQTALDRPLGLPTRPPAGREGPTPLALLAHAATRHRTTLTDTKKVVAYGGWSTSVAGRAVGSVTGSAIEAGGEVGAAFGIVAVMGQLYDAWSTQSDANKAKDDFAMAGLLLAQQTTEKAQVMARLAALPEPPEGAPPPPDEARARLEKHLGLCDFNIKALTNLRDTYIKAYFSEEQQKHIQTNLDRLEGVTTDLANQMVQMDRLGQKLANRHAALDALADPSLPILPDDGERRKADLNEECLELKAEIDGLLRGYAATVEALPDMLTIGAVKREAKRELAQLKERRDQVKSPHGAGDAANAEAIQQINREIDALKAKIKAFSGPSPKKLILRPFDGNAPAELKLKRDARIQVARAGVDGSAVATAIAGIATEVASSGLASLGLGVLSGALGIYMARVDVKDARREMEAASSAKGAALEKIVNAGRLVGPAQHPDGRADLEQRALARTTAWGVLRTQGRAFRIQHRASNQAHLRSNKGTGSMVNGGLSIILASVAIGVGVGLASAVSGGVLTAPAVAIGASIGGVYIGSVAVRARQRNVAKDALKERTFAARVFIERFGVGAFRRLIVDVELNDRQALRRWENQTKRLVAELKSAPQVNAREADKFDWGLFDPRRLRENEFLLVESLTQGLHELSRDRTSVERSDEVAVLRTLQMPEATIQHIIENADNLDTPEHLDETRFILCNFMGLKDYPLERLTIHRAPMLQQNVGAMNHLLLHCSPGVKALMAYLVNHREANLREVQAHFGPAMPLLLAELDALRTRAGERYLIGRDQFTELQQQTEALMPLGSGVLVPTTAGTPVATETEQQELACLLEILADPSLLEPRSVARPRRAPLQFRPADKGAVLLKHLNTSMKAQGKALRQKTAAEVPAAMDAEDTVSAAETPVKKPLLKRGRESVDAHWREKAPNPMGTPKKALARLGALRARHDQGDTQAGDELVQDVGHILGTLAKLTFGEEGKPTRLPFWTDDSPDHPIELLELLEDPNLFSLEDLSMDPQIVGALNEALGTIVSAARATLSWMERERSLVFPSGREKKSASLDRVRERMEGLEALAWTLKSCLADPSLRPSIVACLKELGIRAGQAQG